MGAHDAAAKSVQHDFENHCGEFPPRPIVVLSALTQARAIQHHSGRLEPTGTVQAEAGQGGLRSSRLR